MQDLSTNGFKLNGVDYRSGRKLEVEGRDLGSGKRGVVLVHGDRIHLQGWDGGERSFTRRLDLKLRIHLSSLTGTL